MSAIHSRLRVLLAGVTGAIGKRLGPLLVSRGFTVYGTTRFAQRAEELRTQGIQPIIVDVFDASICARWSWRSAPKSLSTNSPTCRRGSTRRAWARRRAATPAFDATALETSSSRSRRRDAIVSSRRALPGPTSLHRFATARPQKRLSRPPVTRDLPPSAAAPAVLLR
jgi:nucleoside-diphosphate-sugar epimerase